MRLAKREKFLVSLAGFTIALLILFHFFILPFFEKKDNLEKGVVTKEAALEKMMLMSAEYKAHKKNAQRLKEALARRKKGVTLFSFLEEEANKAEVKGHIKYMKPSESQGKGPYKESMVEMKLSGITLKQLAGYLYRIESPENVISIKRISIKENTKEPGYLDTILMVVTLK
jgi:general secretion pathway protein M